MGSSNRTTKKIVDIAPKRKPGEPFIVAGTPQGIVHAAISRAVYQQERDVIRTRRTLRRMNASMFPPLGKNAQQETRGGFGMGGSVTKTCRARDPWRLPR